MSSKLNVLILYSCSEWPFRRTFKSFLESFEKYSDHNIFYVNFPFFFPKNLLGMFKWDIIIFTHSFTAPWNRERHLRKITLLEELMLKAQKKIAFFQDEYINTDITQLFLDRIKMDHIYTVAPNKEWKKLYPTYTETKITQYLTGYIDESDILYAEKLLNRLKKDIDISYRTAYSGPAMAALGDVGWLKVELAEFGKKLDLPHLDIQIGSGFLTGDDWFKLLARSRFTLGVPSGSNVLDQNGSLSKLLRGLDSFSRNSIREKFEKLGIKQDFKLEVISPRIFEAGLFDCCQILVEGDYNGILKKNIHYIPINRDLSNIDEVKSKIEDKFFVQAIVKNFKSDIILNSAFHYKSFVTLFFENHAQIRSTNTFHSWKMYCSIKLMNLGLYIYNIKILKKLKASN